MIYIDKGIYSDKTLANPHLWFHLFSDLPIKEAEKELVEFGKTIGLKKEWFQHREDFPHFDVKGSMATKCFESHLVSCCGKNKVVEVLRRNRATRTNDR